MSASKKTTEEEVLKAVQNLGADMVDVLDAIHSTLMELNSKLADMKGHLDLTTALTLSERIGVSASELGIEVSIPEVNTTKKLKERKKDTTDEKVESEEEDEDKDNSDVCDDSGVCHYG